MLVLAATLSGRQSICEFDFTQPVAIVIGNEGQGVRPELIAACSAEVTIPQASNFDSLNAAVAAGVMLYETHRQRRSLECSGLTEPSIERGTTE